MNDCTTVFETLKDFLPMNLMERAIDETGTDFECIYQTSLENPLYLRIGLWISKRVTGKDLVKYLKSVKIKAY